MKKMTKWGKLFIGAKKEILGASNGIGQKTFDNLVASANQLGGKASLEDIAAHAGLKKGSTQWLLDNYGGSAKSKSPLTLSNGHSPTEQAQINAQRTARRAELKQKYGSVAEYKAQKAEAARRSAAEAKIAQQNPGGFRVNNSSLDEFDKAHSVSDAEMRKRRIETAAHKIADRGKFGNFGGLEDSRGIKPNAADRQISAYQQSSENNPSPVRGRRSKQLERAQKLSGNAAPPTPDAVEKSINRHVRAQQNLANEIEDARQVEHSGDGGSRLQQAEVREQQRQLKERLRQRAGSATEASSGFRKANEAWNAADAADTVPKYGGLGASEEELKASENAMTKWQEAQSDNKIKPTPPPKPRTKNEIEQEDMEQEYKRGVADGSINPSGIGELGGSAKSNNKPQPQSGGGSTGKQSGSESTGGQSGGDTLLAKMQARAAKADSSADKYMFGTRLSNKIQEFEADMAGVKDGNFKEVADKYGLSGTKEDKLRGQFEKQINTEAGRGHTTMDWVYGNDVPQKAIGGVAIAGAMSAIFGGGQKSNSDLYSNPFQ